MCGLAGAAFQTDPALPFLTDAISRLEYRGYDSWGVAVAAAKGFSLRKRSGAFSEADRAFDLPGRVGIAHTRWATHGEVSEANAHPILGGDRGRESVAVCHNGVVENQSALRADLQALGYRFESDTDTEVIAHYLDFYLTRAKRTVEGAIQGVLKKCKGRYSFVFLWRGRPTSLFAVHNGCPLLVSGGMVGSDPVVFAGRAESCVRMRPGEWATLSGDKHFVLRLGDPKPAGAGESVAVPDAADLEGGHPHRMLAEIHEQVGLVADFCATAEYPHEPFDQVVLYGCGSSYHACQVAAPYLRRSLSVPVLVEYASELSPAAFTGDTLAVAVTQSGETRDTLDVMPAADEVHSLIVTNVAHSEGSARASPVLIGAGPEYGVAATKTFTLSCLRLVALAEQFGMAEDFLPNPKELAGAFDEVLARRRQIGEAARFLLGYDHALLMGRNGLLPIAREAALKLKEVAYLHAEAMPAAEIKHGPIALIDEKVVTIPLVASEGPLTPRICANVSQVRARGGSILAVCVDGVCDDLPCDHLLRVPKVDHPLGQALAVNVALQLLAYELALLKGLSPDRPRALSKAQTVV
jgi:glucosamine--fructose-6-phosphate aminotransferase (isomerizing)